MLASVAGLGVLALLIYYSSITWNELPPECHDHLDACLEGDREAFSREQFQAILSRCFDEANICRADWEVRHGRRWVMSGFSPRKCPPHGVCALRE